MMNLISLCDQDYHKAINTNSKLLSVRPLTMRVILTCIAGLAGTLYNDCGDCPASHLCYKIMNYIDKYTKGTNYAKEKHRPRYYRITANNQFQTGTTACHVTAGKVNEKME